MAFLEVKGIQKKFGDTEVLKGIDFTLEKGEVLSIIGSSGSGKTTLLRCINFLESADNGQIILNDDVIFDAKRDLKANEAVKRQQRSHFGLVFQSFNLFPQYNVLQNVSLAMDIHSKEEIKKSVKNPFTIKKMMVAEKAKNREAALKVIEKVGLLQKIYNYPCELSGGQQQRVAIARALALSPEILCFDEPTSALDPELTGEVLKVIRGLKSADMTMIIVTHEMDFARQVSDKVIYMANGVIEVAGTPEEVFAGNENQKLKTFLRHALDNLSED